MLFRKALEGDTDCGGLLSYNYFSGEGGPYGMALLAAYMIRKVEGETLADYLDNKVFAGAASTRLMAERSDIDGFNAFLARYKSTFIMEKAAVEGL